MPNYNAQVSPYSIFPGDVALAFNSGAPAAGQASPQFAPPSYAGTPNNGRTIVWQRFTARRHRPSASFYTSGDERRRRTTCDHRHGDGGRIADGAERAREFRGAKVSSITGGAGAVVQILG